jgi:hypothetical protein
MLAPDDLAAPIAMRHNDPIVKAFVFDFLPLFFQRRRQLRAPYFDADGNLLLPAMPEFLSRLPVKYRKGDRKGTLEQRPDLNFRRADGCAKLCRIWSVVLACTDHLTKEIREPNPSAHGGHRYLSVARLADEATVDAWEAERGLHWLRAAKQITFTKQFREERPDGSHRSTDAALRRVSYNSLKGVPCTRRVIAWRTGKLGQRAAKTARRAARQGIAADIIRDQNPAPPTRPTPLAQTVPPQLLEQVAKERPDLTSLADLLAEARRRTEPS